MMLKNNEKCEKRSAFILRSYVCDFFHPINVIITSIVIFNMFSLKVFFNAIRCYFPFSRYILPTVYS